MKDSSVYIDGELLEEPYVESLIPDLNIELQVVNPDHLLVLYDTRNVYPPIVRQINSKDIVGYIK